MSAANATRHRRIAACLRCHRDQTVHGRGLCRSCFVYISFKGELDNWPRKTHRIADVAEDFLILQGRGMELPAIATRLGYANVSSLAGALVHAYQQGYLRKTQLPHGMWRARDKRRDEGPLEPHERQLLQHCATAAAPDPSTAFGITPATVRTYKFRIRRKLGVDSWDDAVKAFVAEAVLAS